MATFIPERVGTVSARGIHVKRALSALDDAYVVRTPLRTREWTPDFFVQHPTDGWLAIVVSTTPYAAMSEEDLFGNPKRDAFERQLGEFRDWPSGPNAMARIGKLVVMWAFSPEEVQAVSGQYRNRFGLRLLSRKQFLELGASLVPRLLEALDPESEQRLMQRCFPEAEIPSSSTTRRRFVRDNTARLQHVFLDHQQEWAAKLDLEPPEQADVRRDLSVRLVNGVAGSGKTLIALSRALLLAELFPHQQVLMLIHNTPVTADIKANLIRRRGALPDNLEISTYFAWVVRQWRLIHLAAPKLTQGSEQVEDLIRHFRTEWPDLKHADAQLRQELDFINETLVTDAAQYAVANRAGRGFSLRAKERDAVWALYAAVTSALEKSGLRLWSALPRDLCLSAYPVRLQKYDHVLIDEAQFFAPSWFQSVRLATTPAASVFLCADPNQGFMKNRLSWKSVGLEVAGRTKKLRKSYRTTQAILQAASTLLARHAQGDAEDFLVPDLGGMEPGVPPMLIPVDSPQDAVDRLVNELQATLAANTFALDDVLVIYGEKVQKRLLYDSLCRCVGAESVWWFNKDKKAPPHGHDRSYLRMANLDTATGLEAGVVFLIGVENLLEAAGQPRSDDETASAEIEESTRKLYMAMTRAAMYLVLLSSRQLPASVRAGFNELQEEGAGTKGDVVTFGRS